MLVLSRPYYTSTLLCVRCFAALDSQVHFHRLTFLTTNEALYKPNGLLYRSRLLHEVLKREKIAWSSAGHRFTIDILPIILYEATLHLLDKELSILICDTVESHHFLILSQRGYRMVSIRRIVTLQIHFRI
jgi:hypothetical protein